MSCIRPGFTGEAYISCLLTGYGQWEYNAQANNSESETNHAWIRLAFAGLKFDECRPYQRADQPAGGDKADAWSTGLKYDASNISLL